MTLTSEQLKQIVAEFEEQVVHFFLHWLGGHDVFLKPSPCPQATFETQMKIGLREESNLLMIPTCKCLPSAEGYCA